WLLTARHTRAVIHPVPIGRLDDPAFIPRYTAYFTVYFAADDSNLRDEGLWVGTEFGWAATEGVQIDEELSRWVAAGRLFWLEGPVRSRLVNTPAEAFLYGAVTPRGWYRIGPGGLVSDPEPFHLVYRGPALAHDDSLTRSFEL